MKTLLLATSAICGALSCATAFAQTTDQLRNDRLASASEASVGDIIVTARRREEQLKDVPISVSALSGAALEDRGVTNIAAVQNVTPGLTIQNTYTQRSVIAFSLRGQRSQESQLLTDQPVGVYFAEVNQPRPYGLANTFFDLQSVQILKGVQGTLFGRNMTGGAVLVEPQHPTDRFEGEIRGTLGNFDLRALYGMINIPLGDKAALRIAGKTNRRAGWAHEATTGLDYDNQHYDTLRGSLLVRPGDGVEILTIADWYSSRERGTAAFMTSLDMSPGSTLYDFYEKTRQLGVPLANLPAEFAQAQVLAKDFRFASTAGSGGNLNIFGSPHENVDNWGVTNKITYELNDNITFKNIAGYRHVRRDVVQDFDGIPAVIIEPNQRQNIETFSEEFQLQGKALENKLTYILGAFAFREQGSDDALQNTLPELTILGAEGVSGLLNRTSALKYSGYQLSSGKATSYAAFAAGTYNLTENFKISAGLRYNYDKREATVRPQTPGLGICTFDLDVNTPGIQSVPLSQCSFNNAKSWDALTYDATLQYQPNSSITTYVSYRKGYRSGGFSLRAANPVAFQPFNPENVKEYELGLKTDSDIGIGHLTTSTALWYQDSRNVQKQRTQPVTLLTIIDNTAHVRAYGGEFEGTVRFPFGVSLTGYYAYINQKILEGAVFGRLGNQEFALRGAPQHQWGTTVTVDVPTPEGIGRTTLMATYAWRGFAHLDDFDVEGDEPAYGLLNLRAEVGKIGGTGLSLAAFANNVANKRYRAGVQSLISELGYTASVYGEPRTYGLEVAYRF